jgi:exocyst complex protein 7
LLITSLFPNNPPSSLLPGVIGPPISAIIYAIQPTISTIKRSLSTHTFLALELYTALISAQSTFEHVSSRCLEMAHSPQTPELISPLSPILSILRSLVLRSFPELLVDIRSTSAAGNTSGIADTTYTVLTYIETLPAYEKTVENLLGKSHSERSWLMGAKDAPSPVRSAAEEGGIVNLFVGKCNLPSLHDRADSSQPMYWGRCSHP